MNHLLRRILQGLVIAGLAIGSGRAYAATEPVPAVDFFRWPALASPRLSLDGTRLAMIVAGPEGRQVLAVAGVDTPTKPVGIAHLTDADVRSFAWVNDRRLVFDVTDFQAPLGEQWGGGLYAIDVDGSDFKWLVGRGRSEESGGHAAVRPLRWNHRLAGVLRDGSDDVVVERRNLDDTVAQDRGSLTPMRLNTRTRGVTRLVRDEPRNAGGWAYDHAGQPRAAVAVEDRKATVLWRPSEDKPWEAIARYDIYDPGAAAMEPLAVDRNGLLVRAVRSDQAGTYALVRYDTERKAPAAEPLLGIEGFDFSGRLLLDRGNGRQTLYAHLQRGSLRVSSGQSVSRGQRIASVGTSGGSTGPHLHFEQKLNGSAVSIVFNDRAVVYYNSSQTLTSRNCSTSSTTATGTVNTVSGVSLNGRAQPTTNSSIVGSVADGQRVSIYCQIRGQTITGTYGTSSLWNRIGSGRYIPDAYTYTGSDGQVAPSC